MTSDWVVINQFDDVVKRHKPQGKKSAQFLAERHAFHLNGNWKNKGPYQAKEVTK